MLHSAFRRTLLCAIVMSGAIVASAKTVTGSEQDANNRPAIDKYGHVAFQNDGFDYSYENLSRFSYTYDNEKGESVTVPLTTPATTRNAMIALLREVYTNPAIPGRKWVHRDAASNRNIYVDYTLDEGSIEVDLFGLTPGHDYTPDLEGETLLLVEGVDNNDPANGTDGFDRLKRITLVTNRFTLDNNSNTMGINSPGYVFNISKPLYKFYFISKGKARNTHNYPLGQLFEEYSPNEEAHGLDQAHEVYNSLLTGKPYYVRHDCSTVVYNTGHFMVMGSLENASPADISMSVFLPFYRSYDDVSDPSNAGNTTNDAFTWYDPLNRPFFYHYSINLAVESQINQELIDESGFPTYADVTLNWDSNFRSKLFNTHSDEEFWAYKVVNGVIDQSNPIRFTSTHQESKTLVSIPDPENPDNAITIPNPYNQVTVIDGDRVVSNYDDEPVKASYLEPIEDEGRYVSYVIMGKHVNSTADLAQSNIVKVYIPGRNEMNLPGFEIAITGERKSEFTPSNLTNVYNNPIVLNNRDGNLSLKGMDVNVGGVFTLYRSQVVDGVTTTKPIATITVVADALSYIHTINDDMGNPKIQWRYRYLRGTLENLETGEIDPRVTWKSVGERDINTTDDYAYGPIVWHMALNEDGTPQSNMGIDDFSNVLAVINDNFSESTSANDHPEAYRYYMTYEDANSSLRSNIEDIRVYKSNVVVSRNTMTFDDIIAAEDNYSEITNNLSIHVTVEQNPNIKYYRVRLKEDDNMGNPQIVALVQNYNNRFTISIPDGNGNYIPLDDVVEVASGEVSTLTIPLQHLRPDYHNMISEGAALVADVICERKSSPTARTGFNAPQNAAYNTYGTPEAVSSPLPQLYISQAAMGDFNNRAAQITTPRLTNIQCQVDYLSAIPEGFKPLGVSHFVIWRDGVMDGEAEYSHPTLRYNDYGASTGSFDTQAGSFTSYDSGIYKKAVFYSEDNSDLFFGEGMPATANSVPYTIRAYVAMVPKASDDSRMSVKSASPIVYLPAENSILVRYSHDYMVTGVEDVVSDKESITIADGMIIGNAPISIYNAAGTLVTKIVDGANSRPVPSLPVGIYIATDGQSSVKYVQR